MSRRRPAVAAHVDVVPVLGRDQPDVFALSFRTFARAAADRHLHLVRRPDPFVAILQSNRETHRILNTVATPGGAHTALDRSQSLPVGMTAFKTGSNQILPDRRQVLQFGSKQIDPLTARDFGVQSVAFGDFPQNDQPVGSDFTSGNTRHDGIGPVALSVGQKPIITVLQRLVFRLQNVIVPQAGQNRCHSRLADFAAVAARATFFQHLGKCLQPFGPDNSKQLCP